MKTKMKILVASIIALSTIAISLSIALPILSTPIDDEITQSIQDSVLKMKDFKWLNPDYNYVERREKGEDGLWNRGKYGLGYFTTQYTSEGIVFNDVFQRCYDPREGSKDYLTGDTSNIRLSDTSGNKAYVLTQYFNVLYFHSFNYDSKTNENLDFIVDFISEKGFSYYKNSKVTNEFIEHTTSGYYKIEFYGKENLRVYEEVGTKRYYCDSVLVTGFVLHKGLHSSRKIYGKLAGDKSFENKLTFIDDEIDIYSVIGCLN